MLAAAAICWNLYRRRTNFDSQVAIKGGDKGASLFIIEEKHKQNADLPKTDGAVTLKKTSKEQGFASIYGEVTCQERRMGIH